MDSAAALRCGITPVSSATQATRSIVCIQPDLPLVRAVAVMVIGTSPRELCRAEPFGVHARTIGPGQRHGSQGRNWSSVNSGTAPLHRAPGGSVPGLAVALPTR